MTALQNKTASPVAHLTPSDVEETFTASGFVSASPLTILRLTTNGKFVPESLLGYEAGYRRLLGVKLNVDIAAFHNQYGNLLSAERASQFLETSPQPQHFVIPITVGNGLYGSTSGFEIAPDWRPASWWRLNGSYAYLYMELNAKASSSDRSTARST